MKEKLTEELKKAMKARDEFRTSVLRMILAEVNIAEKSGKDFEYMEVIAGYAKKLKKSIAEYRRLNLAESVAKLEKELSVVEEFLPEQISDAELSKIVEEVIETNKFTSKDVGKAIGLIMKRFGDVVDGERVQAIVRGRLVK